MNSNKIFGFGSGITRSAYESNDYSNKRLSQNHQGKIQFPDIDFIFTFFKNYFFMLYFLSCMSKLGIKFLNKTTNKLFHNKIFILNRNSL